MKEDKLMAHDPLSDADAILSEEYYGRRRDGAPADEPRKPRAAANGKQTRPTHYARYWRGVPSLSRSICESARRISCDLFAFVQPRRLSSATYASSSSMSRVYIEMQITL